MLLKEAVKAFVDKYPDKKILEGYEYDSSFVFSAVSRKTKVSTEPFFDCQFSVDKKTGKISTFQPFFISPDEYGRGKKIL